MSGKCRFHFPHMPSLLSAQLIYAKSLKLKMISLSPICTLFGFRFQILETNQPTDSFLKIQLTLLSLPLHPFLSCAVFSFTSCKQFVSCRSNWMLQDCWMQCAALRSSGCGFYQFCVLSSLDGYPSWLPILVEFARLKLITLHNVQEHWHSKDTTK